MNLIGDPWIPVVTADGRDELLGLCEIYEQAADIRDLVLPPPQRIAVMRLLLCITHAAINGPNDKDDWRACRERIVPESLAYLEQRREVFELFGEKPFLQVKSLVPIDNATLDKLDFRLAAGNNPTLFDQEGGKADRLHTPAWIARQLLTYQCFSPGGTIGNTKWNGDDTGRNSEHAPCVETCPLLTIVRRADLLDTIHSNMVDLETINPQPLGQPLWDLVPDGQATELAGNIARSLLGRLVPLSRGIVLNNGSTTVTLVNGISYPKFPIIREPMATVIIKGEGKDEKLAYLSINLAKHPWRELSGILAMRNAGQRGSAYALRHLLHTPDEQLDIWVGGLVADRGKLIDSAEWVLSIPGSLIDSACLALYGNGVSLANHGEASLRNAVKEYCSHLKLELSGFTRKASVHYWSTLDAQYGQLIDLANEEACLAPWRESLRRAMRESYEAACPHTTPRQIQAFASGQRKMYLRDSVTKTGGNNQ